MNRPLAIERTARYITSCTVPYRIPCTILYIILLISISLPFLHAHDKDGRNTKNIPFWSDGAGTPAQRFELAKRTTPELIAFMRRMPKGADLHNHIGGAVFSEHMLDRAAEKDLRYNLKTNQFTYARGSDSHIITIDELKRNPGYLSQYLNHSSIRGWLSKGGNGHDHFFSAFPKTKPARLDLPVIIGEVVKRNRYQNIQYLELMIRSVPPEIEGRINAAVGKFDVNRLEEMFARVQPVLKDPQSIATIREYLDRRDTQTAEILGGSVTGNDGDLVIRYIHQVNRVRSVKSFFGSAVSAILSINNDSRVVGLNILAPEDWPASRLNFKSHMEILDFLWNRMGKPKFALHAGELTLRESPVEPMRDRISATIERGHALRIGHGVSIAWENDVVGVLEKMSRERILVEFSPSSSEYILGLKGADHPFMLYRRAGVPLSINTDDEGVSRSNLTMEFVKVIRDFDLGYEEVKTLVRNSLEYSFLSGKSLFINHDYSRLHKGFERVRTTGWKPKKKAARLISKNPKLNRQVVLERALVEFETFLLKGFGSRK